MTDREKLIKELEALENSMYENQCYACSYEFIQTANEFGTNILRDTIELLTEQPEIVRCKNCVNSGTSRCPCHYSGDPYIDWHPDDNWFCADGEKR